MQQLRTMLSDSDSGLLYAIAGTWGVSLQNLDAAESVARLTEAMLNSERATRQWDALSDAGRGALQVLIASGRKMPVAGFERLYGKIRKLGRAQIEREQPHKNAASIAELLFYRGFIGEAFEQTAAGMRPVIYIATDMAQALPLHKTSYAHLKADPPPTPGGRPTPLTPLAEDEIDEVRHADTSIVDDLTTLLAYLRVHTAAVEEGIFLPVDSEKILPHLLDQDPVRLAFLLGAGLSAELIQVHEGRAYAGRAKLQAWLSAPRATQIKDLAEAWRGSSAYAELWHITGLYPEPGWAHKPATGREAALRLLREYTPAGQWWSLDEFIDLVKVAEPDFQRPDGDYESWYIRNDEGEYLRGFTSWDAVEGALLEFLLQGPLHWLGLADASADAVRLNAYGRAFLGQAAWPNPAIKPEAVLIQPDGTLLASRKVPTVDRFQLARFTTWQPSDTPYLYKLDAASLQQAAAQGITPAHIATFLKRQLDNKPLPARLLTLLESWQGSGPTEVSFERLLVIRTTAPEVLDRLYEAPPLRRYLKARLGPMAGVIDADHAAAFKTALEETGLKVEVRPHDPA
ncbi:MAG: helicase-associated domain-containing protein [Anaerolineae bacterium]|jgi:hypothetical protein|nr:helicase-associated domain-containing protein [Anaerolineae bacterium]